MYIAVFIVVILFALKNYHATVLAYAGFRLFFHTGVALHYTPPLLTLDFACCCVFIALACIRQRLPRVDYDIKIGFCALLVSYVIAIFSSFYPVESAFPPMLGKTIGLIFCLLFLHELKNIDSIKIFVTSFGLTMMVFILYGMFEYVIQSNPVIDFERTMFPEDMKNMIYLSEQIRMGSRRCQSFAAISISYGALCVCWLSFVVMTWKLHINIFKSKTLMIVFCCLSVFCALSTGSKSPFIFLCGFIYAFIVCYQGLFKIKLFIIVFFSSLLILGSSFVLDFIMQIMDSSKSSTEGSDIPMRINQFFAVVDVLDGNYLQGLGAKGVMRAQQLKPAVLGAESIWFQLILEQGLIGIFAYLFCLKKVALYAKKKVVSDLQGFVKIFIISWLCLNTVSSLPGIDLVNLFCILFAFVRYLEITPSGVSYKREKCCR